MRRLRLRDDYHPSGTEAANRLSPSRLRMENAFGGATAIA